MSKLCRVQLAVSLAFLLGVGGGSAHAQTSTYYWNAATPSGFLWSDVNNWWTSPDGSVVPVNPAVPPGLNDLAVFNGTGVNGATTVQINSATAALGLTFANSGTTLLDSSSTTSNTLTIGASGITINSGAGAVTLGDSTNLMPIALSASQSWTNNSSNLFAVVNGISAATAGSKVLTVAGAGNTTLSGALTNNAGTLGLVKSGTGTLTLSGSGSNYSGNVVVSQGTLVINNASAVGAATNNITLGDAGTGSNAVTLKFDTGLAGTATFSSVFTSNFGTSQTIILNAGSALGANGNAFIATINLAGSVPLTLQATNTGGHTTAQDWTGQIVGTGVAAGSTALTLDGTAATLRMTFGGTSTTAANTFTGNVIMKGSVTTQNTTFGGAGTQNAAHQNLGFLNNDVTVSSGTWTIVWGGETVQSLNGSGSIALNNQNAVNNIGLTIGNNNADGGSFGGVISGGFGVAKIGTGTQTFTGSSTYTGTTTVSGGTLKLQSALTGNAGNVLTSAIAVGPDGTLTAVKSNTGFANRARITSLNIGGSGIININNAANSSGTTDGGWFVVGNSGNTSTFTNFTGTLNINSGGFGRDFTAANSINFTGTVNVAAGAVFGAGRGGNSTIGVLTGAGDVSTVWSASSAGSITFGNGNGSGTFSGRFRGNGNATDGSIDGGVLSIIKIGTGTETLNGSVGSTYTGSTTVNGGALKLDFANMATPTNLLTSSSALTLGGGSLSILGKSTGGTSQTLGNLTLTAGTTSSIVLNPNGGTSTNLTLGSTWNVGAGAVLLIDLSAPGTSTLTSNPALAAGAFINTGIAVRDATGTGFATVTSGKVVRLAGTVLTSTSDSATTNFSTTPTDPDYSGGTLTMAPGSHATNTLTINTGVGGILDLNGTNLTLTANTLLADGTGDYIIQNGTLGATDSTLVVNHFGTGALTVSATVSGGIGGLTKNGTGTLILSGASTYTGTTAINGGVLQANGLETAGTSGPLGIGGTISFGGGTLQYSAANTFDYSSRFGTAAGQLYKVDTNGQTVTWATALTSTGGALTKLGAGTLVLTGANTYAGGTTVSGGTLQLGDGTLNPTVVGSYSVGSGGLLRVQYNAGGVTGNPTLSTVTGTGTLALATGKTFDTGWASLSLSAGFTGTLQIEGGRVAPAALSSLGGAANIAILNGGQLALYNLGNGTLTQNLTIAGTGYGEAGYQSAIRMANAGQSTTLSGSITLSASATLAATATSNVSGAISGAGGSALTFGTSAQNGTVILSGANTYQGQTIVANGILEFAKEVSLYNNVQSNWTAANIVVNGGTTLAFNVGGTGEFTAADLDILKTLGTSTGGFKSGSSLGIDTTNAAGGTFTYAGVLTNTNGGANTLGLAKLGTGTLVLTGANTYTGATTISAGTLQVGDGTTNGAIAGSITDNAALVYNVVGSQIYNGVISGTGTVTKTGAGALFLGGANTFTGATTISGGSVSLNTNASFANTGSITIASGTTLYLAGTGNNQIQSAATTPSLIVNGTLAVTNSAAETMYATTITLNNGTLAAANNTTAFGAFFIASTNGGRTVTANGSSNLITGTGAVGIQTGAVLTLNTPLATDSLLVAGTIGIGASGTAGGLTKSGLGTVILAGSNVYTGNTTISGGTLELATTGTLAATAITVQNGGTLQVDVTGKTLSSLTLQSGAVLAIAASSSATTNVTGAITFTTTPNFTVRPLFTALPTATTYTLLTAGSASVGTPGTITTDLTAYGATRVVGSTAMSGNNLVLTVTTGAASLVWNNNSTDGTWNVNGSQNFLNGVSNDAFMSYDAVQFDNTATPGTVTLSGTLAPSALVVTNTSGTYTFSGTGSIVGATSLSKSNAGTLAINVATNYTGSTTVSGGTLQIGGSGTLGNGNYGGAIAFSNNAAFNYASSANQTLRGNISGAGSVAMNGAGVLTLSGPLSHTGGTTINSGTVRLDLTSQASNAQLNYGTFTVNANGTLELYNIGPTDFTKTSLFAGTGTPKTVFTGSGTIIKSGPGIVDFWASSAATTTSIKNFSGLIDIQGGTLSNQTITDWDSTAAGVNKMSVNIAAGAYFDLRTSNAVIDKLTGAGTVGSSFTAGMILTVGNNGGSSTFSGVIQNTVPGSSGSPTVGLTKVGAGTQTLTGTNTYTGLTTVSGGTLKVNGNNSSATGAVAVNNTATLGGAGTIGGAVTVNSGGNLAPGDGVGTLFTKSNVTLANGGILSIELGALGSSDLIDLSGSAGNLNFVTASKVNLTNSGFDLTSGSTSYIIGKVGTGSIQLNGGSPGSELGRYTFGTGASGPVVITLTPASFASMTDGSTFVLTANGSNLMLTATTAAPEPAYAVLIAAFGLCVVYFVRRRRTLPHAGSGEAA